MKRRIRVLGVLSKIVAWQYGRTSVTYFKTAWQRIPRTPQAALWLIAVLFTALSGASLIYSAMQSWQVTNTVESTPRSKPPGFQSEAEFPQREVTATIPHALPNPAATTAITPNNSPAAVQPASYQVPASATRGAWLIGTILEEPTYTPPTARHDAPQPHAQ